MDKDRSSIISKIATKLLENDRTSAKEIICQEYPHVHFELEKRSYSTDQKMAQFMRDGFVDRYTGKRLLNPGILKILSNYFPEEFPYHAHWKMNETHIAYWELIPTIDHIYPIAKGGRDCEENWVTTSMKNNSIKSNYTIDEILWTLYPKGNITEWDGLTQIFLDLVNNDKDLLKDPYIKTWYKASQRAYFQSSL